MSGPMQAAVLAAAYLAGATIASIMLGRRWRSTEWWLNMFLMAALVPLGIVAVIFGVPRMLG